MAIAPYPAFNSADWDVPLKAYIDTSIADSPGLNAATTRAVALQSVPDSLSAIAGYNIAPWSADNVVTAGGYRYVMYWNSSLNPIIGRWNLATGAWDSYDLSLVTGNPLEAPVTLDGHNNLALGIDPDGYLHVSGNHHTVTTTIHYIRSTSPHVITSWTAPGMIGTEETSVTYPCFFNLPDDTLLFTYRKGGSGDGSLVLNRYDHTLSTWSRLATTLIDGLDTSPTTSPYWNHLSVDSTGALHLFWNWRTFGGGADGNHDLSYAKIIGLGIGQTLSAVKSTGVAQTIPIVHSNCEIVLSIADGSGMANTTGACVDTAGLPHTIITQDDATPATQYIHVWHDGTAWQQSTLTHFSTDIDWDNAPNLCRPALAAGPDGRVLMIYRALIEGRKDALWMADITTGQIRSEWPIARIDIGAESPTYDTRALRDSGQLNMLLTIQYGDIAGLSLEAPAMSVGWGGVLSVDLSRIGSVADGTARIPGLRTVAFARPVVGSAYTIPGTSYSTMPNGIMLFANSPGVQMFVRFVARLEAVGGGNTARIRVIEQAQGQTDRTIAVAATTTTASYSNVWTPWMPLTKYAVAQWVSMGTASTAASGGSVQAASVEIAALEEL